MLGELKRLGCSHSARLTVFLIHGSGCGCGGACRVAGSGVVCDAEAGLRRDRVSALGCVDRVAPREVCARLAIYA